MTLTSDAYKTVSFIHMEDGTPSDFEFLHGLEKEFSRSTAERILEHLRLLESSFAGYKVSRLEHALQTATRALRDDADEEMIVAALLHDIGDTLAPENHSDFAAAILRPFVSPRTHWIIKHHGVFQGYYFFHHLGGDRHARDRYRNHPYYQACADFCADWDQCSFDPAYESKPLDYFAPMVRRVFAREPFSADVKQGA